MYVTLYWNIIVYSTEVSGSLSPWHGASSGCGWRKVLRYLGQLRINWISSRGQPTRGGPQAWGLGEVLTTPIRKKLLLCNTHECEMLPLQTKQSGGKLLPHSDLRGGVFLEEVSRFRKQKRDILLGMWNVRRLYRAGSLEPCMQHSSHAGWKCFL
jgi:hypothetical protein